jgi:hypothetical protein
MCMWHPRAALPALQGAVGQCVVGAVCNLRFLLLPPPPTHTRAHTPHLLPLSAFGIGKFDGILGMAFQSISVDDLPTIFGLMVQQKLVDTAVFAFYLPNTSGAVGELIIGGIDPSHYTGTLSYVPLVSETYWRLALDGLTIDGKVRGGERKGELV